MSGKPGRSGGARPGAGRPKKPPEKNILIKGSDMLKLLQDVALGRIDASALQVRAAIAAVQYTHTKKGDGKKADKQDAAKVASVGKFAPAAPPKLVYSNR
jgi:phage terminase small subunit